MSAPSVSLGDTIGHIAVACFHAAGHDVVLAIVLGINGYFGVAGFIVFIDQIDEEPCFALPIRRSWG